MRTQTGIDLGDLIRRIDDKFIQSGRIGLSLEDLKELDAGTESKLESYQNELLEFVGSELGADSERVRAGVLSALAAKDPQAYRQALKANAAQTFSLEHNESEFAQEAFISTDIDRFTAYNIIYNILASYQDNFSEAFFPTKALDPGSTTFEITLDRQELVDYQTHPNDGSLIDLNRRNIINLFEDTDAVNDDPIRLIPHLDGEDDSEVSEYFVDDDLVPTQEIDYAGETVSYRPLKPNTRINLISLAQRSHSPVDTDFDYTDEIDFLNLDTIYIRVSDGTDEQVVELYVGSMPRNEFNSSHEGTDREATLNFRLDDLYLTQETPLAGGGNFSLHPDVDEDDAVIRFAITVSGRAVYNTGEVEISAPHVDLIEVIDTDGNASEIEDYTAEFIGYDLWAVRSNANWRAVGSMVDTTQYREKYGIYPGYPITALRPAGESSNNNIAKLSSLLNALRYRHRNKSVSTLFDYADQLRQQRKALERGLEADITGIGRYVVTPYYEERTIDVSEDLLRGEEITTDKGIYPQAAWRVLNHLRAIAHDMMSETGYSTALMFGEVGEGVKPKVLIGCHYQEAKFLYVDEDQRLMGEKIDTKIATTSDSRMKGTVFMTFTRERPGSDDGLSFGVHAYVPELIEKVTINHAGAISDYHRVVPRSRHIPILPILAKITIIS